MIKFTDEMRAEALRRIPGSTELEAIAYARGIIKGMTIAGMNSADARVAALACSLDDKLLEAGCALTQVNAIESELARKQ